MAAANAVLLRTLTELWRKRASASVTVDSGRIHRTLHVEKGALVASESDVLTERLGVLLVAEGKLDAARVEPLLKSARAGGRLFGAELLAQGLVDSEGLRETLQRQALLRFDRAVLMPGKVLLAQSPRPAPVCRAPLGALLVAGFRSRLPAEIATRLVASLTPNDARIRGEPFSPEELQLEAEELRCFRQLASGQDAAAVLDRATDYDATVRLIASLVALGAIGEQDRPDPLAELVAAGS